MKTSFIKGAIAATTVASLIAVSPVFAETRAASSTRALVREERMASSTENRLQKARERGQSMIDQRVDSLNKLISRIGAMKHISASDKTALEASLKAEIAALAALKGSIATATSTDLKGDIASVTKSYRIYALVEPQAQIIAAADRALGIVDSLGAVYTKANARLASSTSPVASTTQAFLADYSMQIASSTASAKRAISLVSSLKPDNGDATIAASNKAALKEARAAVVSAQQSLKLAQKDLRNVVGAFDHNRKDLKDRE